jgi:hypothetical protein
MPNKVTSASVLQLVERFDRNRDACAKTTIERQIELTEQEISVVEEGEE